MGQAFKQSFVLFALVFISLSNLREIKSLLREIKYPPFFSFFFSFSPYKKGHLDYTGV